ncbi:hypothetical protein O0555_06295 [Brevibacillus laterosporus]|uniref:Uncharacterized protein n=1 Tax=Brevibacillus laterosporus TaxID=1465 RepID=A0AAP8QEU2_BRELA|nr:hypothetical protein [Brevibacillus laterosporus]MCR8936962.1 hypothetical protein [Brevibacillus laterosporus]MCZ0839600.1 hypothetical protein [Brevibacillus laterosporus]MCZ0844707.1 hypothetical protein [Brevibacillus laterosporus]PPB08278.1 hypothetical protein C4A77_08850 [Brevibacillus laterosporus]
MEYRIVNYAKTSTRATTHHVYKKRVKRYVIPKIGRIKLKDFKDYMYGDLLKDGAKHRKGGISPITIPHIHGLVHKALQNDERWQIVSRNVARLVELLRVEKRNNG